jgi:hypothetical protein
MMASRGDRVLVRSARCILVKTAFAKAGDQVVFTMLGPGLLTPENFTRKTVVTKGKFCTHFNDGDDYTNTGEFWPLVQHEQPGQFTTTALEDNSEYYCVIPVNRKEVVTSTISVAVGEVVQLPAGTINFVYGSNYTINEKSYTKTDVFAIDKQAATLAAGEAVTVIRCESRDD